MLSYRIVSVARQTVAINSLNTIEVQFLMRGVSFHCPQLQSVERCDMMICSRKPSEKRETLNHSLPIRFVAGDHVHGTDEVSALPRVTHSFCRQYRPPRGLAHFIHPPAGQIDGNGDDMNYKRTVAGGRIQHCAPSR